MKRQERYRYQQNRPPLNKQNFNATQPVGEPFGSKFRGKVDSSFLDISQSHESSFLSISMDLILQDNQSILNQSVDQCSLNEASTPTMKINLKRTKSVRFDEENIEEEEKFPSFSKKNNTSRVLVPILKNSSQKSHNNSFSQLNASLSLQFRSQRSNIPARVSVLDDKKNQKRRFVSIVDTLRKNKKKYFDDVFPPGSSSIYFSPKDSRFGDIKWVRICEVMKPKYCTLFNRQPTQKNRIKVGQVPIPYMVLGLSALKNNNHYLEYIFQDPHINEYGIYLLRIFVQGVWRYVIIDDYIPVLVRDRKYIPVFLAVEQQPKNSVEIWPFLVQKAYAKIYSTYQSLLNGNAEDFMIEITGSILQKIEINKQVTNFQLEKHINNNNNIVLLGAQNNKAPEEITYYTTEKNLKSLQQMTFLERITQQLNVTIDNPLQCRHPTSVLISQIGSFFREALVLRNNDSNFQISSHIKQSSSNKETMSIRSFTVNNTTSCDISLFQKDRKFFRKGYDYSWARMIIAMKEAEGIRWVKGTYAKKKCVQLSCILDPGQYYVMIMVDWGPRVYDLHLNYSGNSEISFERVRHTEHTSILTDTCVDLAQRFGEFEQISNNLCSYRHCDTAQGLVIDNINNEHETKQVSYSKSYNKSMKVLTGLKAVNEDFIKNRNIIVTRIKPKSNYTLILKVKNGEDLGVLECFGVDD